MIHEYRHITPKVRLCDNANLPYDSLELSTRFINYTGIAVDVATELGFTITVEPKAVYDKVYEDSFVIQKIIRIDNRQADQLRQYLARYAPSTSEIANHLRPAIGVGAFLNQYKNVVLEFLVPKAEIANSNMPVVAAGTGVMLSRYQNGEPVPHPHSEAGQTQSIHEQIDDGELDPGEKSSAYLNVKIIDNENRIGERYVTIMNKVVRLKSYKDFHKRSGAYISSTRPDGVGGLGKAVDTVVLDIEHLTPENGFYLTREEAEHLGDAKILQATLERENMRLKAELAKANTERDTKNAHFTMHKQRMEHRANTEQDLRGRRERKAGEFDSKLRFFTDLLKHMASVMTVLFGIYKLVGTPAK